VNNKFNLNFPPYKDNNGIINPIGLTPDGSNIYGYVQYSNEINQPFLINKDGSGYIQFPMGQSYDQTSVSIVGFTSDGKK